MVPNIIFFKYIKIHSGGKLVFEKKIAFCKLCCFVFDEKKKQMNFIRCSLPLVFVIFCNLRLAESDITTASAFRNGVLEPKDFSVQNERKTREVMDPKDSSINSSVVHINNSISTSQTHASDRPVCPPCRK